MYSISNESGSFSFMLLYFKNETIDRKKYMKEIDCHRYEIGYCVPLTVISEYNNPKIYLSTLDPKITYKIQT